jgi:hypothetical protein
MVCPALVVIVAADQGVCARANLDRVFVTAAGVLLPASSALAVAPTDGSCIVLLLTCGTGCCTHQTKERRRVNLWGRPGSGQRVRRDD